MATADFNMASPPDDEVPGQRIVMEDADGTADLMQMLAAFHANMHTTQDESRCSEADLNFLKDGALGQGGEASVVLVKHDRQVYAYKKFLQLHGGNAAATATEAAAEFEFLSEVYYQAPVRLSPAGRQQRNVAEVVKMVTDPDQGGEVSGFLMEHLEGGSLLDNLRASAAWTEASPHAPSPLALRPAACFALQASRGLTAFHRADLAHLDVKPSNFVLRQPLYDLNNLSMEDEVLLVDGGLVTHAAGPRQPRMHCMTVNGTPEFMAPEQVATTGATTYYPTPALDAVALGRTLLTLYTWAPPTAGMACDDILDAVRNGTLMAELYPKCALSAPAAFTSVALWLAHAAANERLSVAAATPIFELMHERAAAGHAVTLRDIEEGFSLPPHPLLHRYPTTDCAEAITPEEARRMAWALHRSSGPGEEGADAAVPEIKSAAPCACRSSSGHCAADAAEIDCAFVASPRISAFGERISMACCQGLGSAASAGTDAEAIVEGLPATAADGGSAERASGLLRRGTKTKAPVGGRPANAVAGGTVARTSGLLRRMQALCGRLSTRKLSGAVCCRGTAVQE